MLHSLDRDPLAAAANISLPNMVGSGFTFESFSTRHVVSRGNLIWKVFMSSSQPWPVYFECTDYNAADDCQHIIRIIGFMLGNAPC